jgi:hypothetical protein
MKEKTANTLLCQTGDSQKRMIIIEAQETYLYLLFLWRTDHYSLLVKFQG